MTSTDPATALDPRFSMEGATATGWPKARSRLEDAQVFWLSTVRPEGRPHVTPLIAVWTDDAPHFCTGPDERKAKNLADNPRCIVTSGSDELDTELDIVVEGDAVRVHDDAKYGAEWHFTVRDGAFHHDAGVALVYEIVPSTAFGFRKGAYSQTRWRFQHD